MEDKIVTRRGVYLDLNKSPYKFEHNGETYKFSSKFRLGKYIRDVNTAINKLGNKAEELRELTGLALSGTELDRQMKSLYKAVYDSMEFK